ENGGPTHPASVPCLPVRTSCGGRLASLATMLTISLPDRTAAELVGPLPDDVQVVFWDGTDEPPPEFADVAMYVAAYTENPPSAELLSRGLGLRVVQLLSAGVDPWRGRVPPGVLLCNGRGV